MKFEGDRVVAENFDGLALIRDIERNLGYPVRGPPRAARSARERGPRRSSCRSSSESPRCSDIENRTGVQGARRWAISLRRSAISGQAGFQTFAGQRFDIVVNATSARPAR